LAAYMQIFEFLSSIFITDLPFIFDCDRTLTIESTHEL